jgi:hypothetical protein
MSSATIAGKVKEEVARRKDAYVEMIRELIRASVGGEPAVHGQGSPRDEAGLVRGEKEGRIGHIGRGGQAAERYLVQSLSLFLRVLE